MKAVCIRQPNGDLQIERRPRPSPGPGEVLIRVRACGICHGDLMVQQGAFPFVQYPIVPGHEIAAAVEEIEKSAGTIGAYMKPGQIEKFLADARQASQELQRISRKR